MITVQNTNCTHQPAFGYNYKALGKDLAKKSKEFVCTVPPKEDMVKAAKLGFIEAGKLSGFMMVPALTISNVGLKLYYDFVGKHIRAMKINYFLMEKYNLRRLRREKSGISHNEIMKTFEQVKTNAVKRILQVGNPFNIVDQLVALPQTIAKAKGYLGQFK